MKWGVLTKFWQHVSLLRAELDAAVLDASKWTGVCDRLAAAVGGAGTLMVPIDPSKRGPWLVHSDSIGEAVSSYISNGWHTRDFRQNCSPVLLSRGYATDYDITDDTAMRSNPYYADFLRRQRLGIFIGIHIGGADEDWVASVQLPLHIGPPDNAILERMPVIRALLSNAVRMSQKIGGNGVSTWLSHFENSDRGMVVLGPNGLPLQANAIAGEADQ